MRDCKIYLALLIGIACCCCAPDRKTAILGSWKVDSVYAYYNGFDFWEYEEGADWATYEYTAGGLMKEIKFGTYRPYRYRLFGDTLFWMAEREPEAGLFEILELKSDYMVLRKTKAPLFSGQAQERYEIRFFSRAPASQNMDYQLKQQ